MKKAATVTCYSNGDLEFEGKGELTNFGTSLPWKDCEYTHVYIDETLQIESMDSWFEGNENLVYCTNIPKSVKTMKKTFANCKALEKAPDYFQCSNLKIMDYAFSGCEALKEIDILPVNVSSAQYAFEGCISLQKPADLSKTSNLQDISGLHNGCSNLREATEIPNSVIYMSETFMNCLNIKAAVRFPEKVLDISSAYAGDSALEIGASIPEGVTDFSGCYQGCSALSGTLETILIQRHLIVPLLMQQQMETNWQFPEIAEIYLQSKKMQKTVISFLQTQRRRHSRMKECYENRRYKNEKSNRFCMFLCWRGLFHFSRPVHKQAECRSWRICGRTGNKSKKP